MAPNTSWVIDCRRSAVTSETGPSRALVGAVLLPPPLPSFFTYRLLVLFGFHLLQLHHHDVVVLITALGLRSRIIFKNDPLIPVRHLLLSLPPPLPPNGLRHHAGDNQPARGRLAVVGLARGLLPLLPSHVALALVDIDWRSPTSRVGFLRAASADRAHCVHSVGLSLVGVGTSMITPTSDQEWRRYTPRTVALCTSCLAMRITWVAVRSATADSTRSPDQPFGQLGVCVGIYLHNESSHCSSEDPTAVSSVSKSCCQSGGPGWRVCNRGAPYLQVQVPRHHPPSPLPRPSLMAMLPLRCGSVVRWCPTLLRGLRSTF
jgi:hypothetical protein